MLQNDFDFQQYINERVMDVIPSSFKKEGDKLHGRCPLCGDSRKNPNKKRGWYYLSNCSYYCYNCSTGLTGLSFLAFLINEQPTDIVKEYFSKKAKNGTLGKVKLINLDDDKKQINILDFTPAVPQKYKLPLSDKAKEYLTKRNVLNAPFLKEPIYSTKTKNNEEYILIPWIINGVEAYFQLNDFQKLHGIKYIFPKNKDRLIYGLDNVDISFPYIIIFEGVYDSLFVKNGIAIGGKRLTDLQIEIIKKRYPKHKLVYAFDNDKAGFFAMKNIIQKDRNALFFNWYKQYPSNKDINEIVNSLGNVNIFKEPTSIKRYIVSSIESKLYLINNGIWNQKEYDDKSTSGWEIPGDFGKLLSLTSTKI